MQYLESIVVAISMAVIGFFSMFVPHLNVQQPAPKVQILAATNPIAGATYTLSGSGVTASATSIILTTLTIPQTGYELLDADFSDTFYITLEPGSRSRQEIASCTTVVQNADDTATLSGCTRGLLPFTPYTASSTYRFSHGGGTLVIFSDPPQLFVEFAGVTNNATITAVWSFASGTLPIVSPDTTNSQVSAATNTLATVNYVNTVATSGAADANFIVKGLFQAATSTQVASGTTTGSTGALLAVPNEFFGSTSSARTQIPVTGTDGKLSQVFLDLTDDFAFSGDNAYSGTSTFSASFSASASSSFQATTTFDALVNFNGTIGGTASFPILINATSTATSMANGNVLNLASTTIPADTLTGNNIVRAIYNIIWGEDGPKDQTFRLFYGDVNIVSTTIQAWGATLGGSLTLQLMAAGVADSQFTITTLRLFASDISSSTSQANFYSTSTISVSATSSQTLRFEAECNGGTCFSGGNVFRLEGHYVEKLIL